jgi:phosphoribosylformylglycinamidine synthase
MPDLKEAFLKLLSSPNIASQSPIYERYDKTVQGDTVIERGLGTAGVIAPLLDEDVPDEVKRTGVAVAVEGNPRYGKISPYWQAVNANVGAQRKVAAVGASVIAITDCCNYGNPEDPEQFWEFVEGVQGLSDSARLMGLKDYEDSPTPVISGNVSFYNETILDDGTKTSIDPCMDVAAVGRTDDFMRTATKQLKSPGNTIFLLGERMDELGGSEYYHVLEHPEPESRIGVNVPMPDFGAERIYRDLVVDAIQRGYVSACRDVSKGGVGAAIAEMCLGGNGDGEIGADVSLTKASPDGLRTDKKLFSESGGYLLEVSKTHQEGFGRLCDEYGVEPFSIGRTHDEPVIRIYDSGLALEVGLPEIRDAWVNGLREALR